MPDTISFEEAIKEVKAGKCVGRIGWKNAQYIFLVKGSEFTVNRAPLDEILGVGTPVVYRPHIDMLGADGSIGTWAPSMVDMMEDDWAIVEVTH